jgi:hypothetical protein
VRVIEKVRQHKRMLRALPIDLKRFAMAWLLGGIATMFVLASITAAFGNGGWLGYVKLVNGGANTTATVVRAEPRHHCLAEYTFNIGTSNYTGRGSDCSAGVGKAVSVTYLVADPSHSCLGSAKANLANELATFAVGAIVCPPFLIYALRRRREQRVA